MPCPNAPTAQFTPQQQTQPTAFFRFLGFAYVPHVATAAQAEAYATKTRRTFNGTIAPNSFAGLGMARPY